ncbi:LysR family transcriptional regulator [Defluviimonas sp. WL0024]|uniref:LysR family transcriptional regulator n=1 Tax=Albidovulum salinarum TaxID=2984153 RepID=A0ABT2X179_9RHOB|nr:LysR family transcriptional regulator [Defluviimonas sp. WL0024]MCU9846772.1 LysR family transcriptional regulator [Defluviimonas sp. WL0024]
MENATKPSHAKLADVDLRLLRVFAEIVHANGFSAAQANLGMTQATISAHMRHLEERLGVRLCERGRGGFYLTDEGRQVHSAMLDLFGSIDRFQSAVSEAQGELSGDLSFGTVDAMVTNHSLNLHLAIAEFCNEAPRLRLSIDIAAPQVLSQGILNGRYQIVLMPEQRLLGQTHAINIYDERQNLYCGRAHPLFSVPDHTITEKLLAEQDFAGRTYMAQTQICGVDFNWRAVTAHMEGTLMLLLSGAFIGFLPQHFAEQEVRNGQLRVLAPDRMAFDDTFQIVYPRERPTRAAELLAQAVLRRQHS